MIPFVFGALVFDLALPGDPVTWLAFLVAVLLGRGGQFRASGIWWRSPRSG